MTDRSRFLYIAVLEGLLEDGADATLVRSIVEKASEHFVTKCPICGPVQGAIRAYINTNTGVYSALGAGFPPALAEELKDPDKMKRRAGLEKLVGRYVSLAFERTRMTEAEKTQMRSLLLDGSKAGMEFAKSTQFGERCPSCGGSTKPAK